MGKQAKANAVARQAWLTSLTREEDIARKAAELLLSKLILPEKATGMCYRVTFFLHLYLTELGVPSEPIVGWVTDGRNDLAMSHAWLEVGGKKIDLTLVNVDPGLDAVVGRVLILDRPAGTGAAYAYFRQKEERHLAADRAATAHSPIRELYERKAAEHQQMLELAKNTRGIRQFLDAAPDGLTFELMKRRVFTSSNR
jgi:hypothetical protein